MIPAFIKGSMYDGDVILVNLTTVLNVRIGTTPGPGGLYTTLITFTIDKPNIQIFITKEAKAALEKRGITGG